MTQTTDFAGLPVVPPSDEGFLEPRLQRISDRMAKAVDAGEVPGVVTVVARRGRVVHCDVVGRLDMERPEPLGMDSLFRMYSQTKPITAAVTMSLFEEGVLFLDDPIAKWLPEFANPRVTDYPDRADSVRGGLSLGTATVPARRDITIFDLLTMTSGLPLFTRTPAVFWPQIYASMAGLGVLPGDDLINNPPGSYEDMVLAIATMPLHAQPGKVWNYGSDFDVLSLLLERASGMPLDQLFKQRICDPLGMHDTGFYCDAADRHRLVTDHGWGPEGGLVIRDRPETAEKVGPRERKLMSGNGMFGGVLSAPPDYARFAQMLLNRGSLDGEQILGRKTVELMTTNHIGDRSVDLVVGPGYGFGLGYAVRKGLGGAHTPGSAGTFGWGGRAGTWFFVDPVEELWGMFFTHVDGYQFMPDADLYMSFEKMTYEALA